MTTATINEELIDMELTTFKKINVTKHTLERWIERILELPNSEIANYMNSNRQMLIDNINETFNYATFIYKGQVGGDKVTRNFYLHNDTVFITNTDNTAIITVYKVDLGFTSELNSTVRKGLLVEIEKLTLEKEAIDFEGLQAFEKLQHESKTIDDNINILQQQIEQLKIQKRIVNEEAKLINAKSSYVDKEINKFVLMLVNSLEYKLDIQSI